MTLLLAMLTLAFVPSSALAKGEEVIRDCAQDGDLDGDYSQKELDDAYANLPSDIDEYSDCRQVIEKARERGSGGSNNSAGSAPGPTGTGGGSSGSGSESDFGGSGNDTEELAARERNSQTDAAPGANVAGEETSNAGGTLDTDADSGGMPAALLVALILAILAAIAGVLYLLRDRLPAGIASRLPGSLKG